MSSGTKADHETIDLVNVQRFILNLCRIIEIVVVFYDIFSVKLTHIILYPVILVC